MSRPAQHGTAADTTGCRAVRSTDIKLGGAALGAIYGPARVREPTTAPEHRRQLVTSVSVRHLRSVSCSSGAAPGPDQNGRRISCVTRGRPSDEILDHLANC